MSLSSANSLPALTLVLGGARSGKSRHAEGLLEALEGPLAYIATAEAWDEEMRARIAEHRAWRAARWTTIDAPLDLAGALNRAAGRPVLLDCLTLWLTNLMLGEHDIPAAVTAFERALEAYPAPVVLVSNEVGLGIVPDNALARRFRDEAGRLNQQMARLAGRVLFIAAGLPLVMKDESKGMLP
jgi:adenosyl cobinamide kinase/adenosyl cobinamide phosphate guanylyltransferase